MATRRTQQKVYLTLAAAYKYAIERGQDKVGVHVDWIADALNYMNPDDNSTTHIGLAMDDMTEQELDKLFGNKVAESPSDMYPKGTVNDRK